MRRIYLYFTMMAVIALSACGDNKKPETGTPAPAHKYVRYNVNKPEGQKALQAMKKALDSMRKMDCSTVTSLYYQGAMHWIPDTVYNGNPYCASYTSKADLKTAWDNCTHIPGIEINFLSWHRLYIWHFEKIVRQLSGYQEFALPYWGYTDTVNVEANRILNEMMRMAGSSLYEKSRYDSLNNGYPISGDILAALDLDPLFKKKDIYIFTKNIDAAPHGAMHNYIGMGNYNYYPIWNPIYQCDCNGTGVGDTCQGGLMANVPSAGFDPVFFLHHSNIDRIWQQWTNSSNGKLITVEDLLAFPWGYTFFNPDGSKVEYTAEEVIKAIYNVDYEYDDTPTPPAEEPKKKPSMFLSAKTFADTIVSKNVNQVVKGKSAKFTLQNDAPRAKQLLSASSTPKTAIIILTVSFRQEPKGIYQVYVNLPEGAAVNPSSDYFAGFMTFFGAKHHFQNADASHNEGTASNGNMTKTFIFEMTDVFNASNAFDKKGYDFSIINNDGKGLADIKVEKVSVILK